MVTGRLKAITLKGQKQHNNDDDDVDDSGMELPAKDDKDVISSLPPPSAAVSPPFQDKSASSVSQSTGNTRQEDTLVSTSKTLPDLTAARYKLQSHRLSLNSVATISPGSRNNSSNGTPVNGNINGNNEQDPSIYDLMRQHELLKVNYSNLEISKHHSEARLQDEIKSLASQLQKAQDRINRIQEDKNMLATRLAELERVEYEKIEVDHEKDEKDEKEDMCDLTKPPVSSSPASQDHREISGPMPSPSVCSRCASDLKIQGEGSDSKEAGSEKKDEDMFMETMLAVKDPDSVGSENARRFIELIRREIQGLRRLRGSLNGALKHLGADLYSSPLHFLHEFLQNAEDNTFPTSEGVIPEVRIILADDYLIISNNECGFRPKEVRSLCRLAESTKRPGVHIGQKGLGFKSVFACTNNPCIASRKWRFCFEVRSDQDEVANYITPHWLTHNSTDSDPSPNDSGVNGMISIPSALDDISQQFPNHTHFYLPFKTKNQQRQDGILNAIDAHVLLNVKTLRSFTIHDIRSPIPPLSVDDPVKSEYQPMDLVSEAALAESLRPPATIRALSEDNPDILSVGRCTVMTLNTPSKTRDDDDDDDDDTEASGLASVAPVAPRAHDQSGRSLGSTVELDGFRFSGLVANDVTLCTEVFGGTDSPGERQSQRSQRSPSTSISQNFRRIQCELFVPPVCMNTYAYIHIPNILNSPASSNNPVLVCLIFIIQIRNPLKTTINCKIYTSSLYVY